MGFFGALCKRGAARAAKEKAARATMEKHAKIVRETHEQYSQWKLAIEQEKALKKAAAEAVPERVSRLEEKVDRILVLLGDGQTCVDKLRG